MTLIIPRVALFVFFLAGQPPALAADSGSKLNVNEAGIAELDSLPSVAAFEAEAIVRHRDENGPFESVDELHDVPGVSDRTITNIKGELTAEPIQSRRPR